MAWFKRMFLFAAVNIAIVVTISIILNLLGIGNYRIAGGGIDQSALLALCLVWGMGASIMSLLLSKMIAKWTMKIQIIDPNAGGREGELYRTVSRLAKAAGLPRTPEVGIYQSMEVNAFATGPTRARALVAVSEGLLMSMSAAEVEGVLGHEIAHVANGDMVTMTLIQGVVNAFVMYFARIAAYGVSQFLRGNDREGEGLGGLAYMFTVMAFEIVFGILGSLIVNWFSRHREYRADAGGARFAGRQNMIAALQRLKGTSELEDAGNPSLATLKISHKAPKYLGLFATHPDLNDRIARLQNFTA
ncbi:MAG: protease HtpX [Chitinophagaceae bacterium]|nr:protease HtpX [Oligoflexus sp.]